MALHHRWNVDNMRHAYDNNRSRHFDSSESERSYQSSSDNSYQTQPTVYSCSPAKRPHHIHHNTYDSRLDTAPRFFDDRLPQESPRVSVETYASTIASEEDLLEEDVLPEYDVPEYNAHPYESNVIPATPSDFSELFPSKTRLHVRHDDSTLDGNMNLRIDTEAMTQGRRCEMTLFHLRMHDLKEREFSLRRYCRDSGREVCHSSRKPQKQATAGQRPSFQRSLSNAFSSKKTKSDTKTPTLQSLKRNDSGYGSMHSMDLEKDEAPRLASQSTQQASNDTMKLEFSNYAHVDVKRTGVKGSKRYDFEYWGVPYAWRRVVFKESSPKRTSYHLTRAGSEQVLAYIVPTSLTNTQSHDEEKRGGWVPPCTMWLADDKLVQGQKDAVDVVMAAGLTALVDDAIRMRFQSKTTKQILIPKMQMGVEWVGPRQLINEMFRRDSGSSQQSRASTSSRPSTSSHCATTSRMPPGAVRHNSFNER
ncbi:hypothetical protein B0A50_02146 [Salinomyces thailandicus]|uniref:Uncharacterized protein n=1 Tax=Salinomyces thailandicus TaxID=706561 RepID=A0A4U0U7R5_9PEZI|nr:hypothetical protein B0A50_02146 [Salinomyces thailandica]